MYLTHIESYHFGLSEADFAVKLDYEDHHVDIVTDYLRNTFLALETNYLFECADNFRIARTWEQDEVAHYDEKRDGGCCGFHDTGLNTERGTIRIGWNYGH
jgi:hypothetical protein